MEAEEELVMHKYMVNPLQPHPDSKNISLPTPSCTPPPQSSFFIPN